MYLLLLNDMRNAKSEDLQPVARADTLDSLWAFVRGEHVEGGYQDANENIQEEKPPGPDTGPFGSCHGANTTWAKGFKKGGPLEWFNLPNGIDMSVDAAPTLEWWGINVQDLPGRDQYMHTAGESWDRWVGHVMEVGPQS